MQLVLQDPTGALNPRHTVYEAVAEGLRVHGLVEGERARVAEALSLAGLRPPERFFLRYPHELSGGMRQRVVIAGALALEPDIIVADEPVSSLAITRRGEAGLRAWVQQAVADPLVAQAGLHLSLAAPVAPAIAGLAATPASRVSSPAMASRGSTRWTAPARIASRFMPKTTEEAASGAIFAAPAYFISRSPSAPSAPIPVRITPSAVPRAI